MSEPRRGRGRRRARRVDEQPPRRTVSRRVMPAGAAADATSTAAPPELTLRRAVAADLPVVLELRFALLREHSSNPLYGRLRRDARQRAERLYATQLAAATELTVLAEWNGRVVGILRCMVGQGSPLLEPDAYGYVASVYVRPAYRRRGVLRALLAEAERWCRERGLTEMRLHNAVDSMLANASWEALGFQAVEVLRIRPLG